MNDKDIITIVSGLPRSGTSMMMKMLEAGGFPALTDNIRKADEDNPLGYYEFEDIKDKAKFNASIEKSKGYVIKLVSELLYKLPDNFDYKVIFMRRNMNEILESQKKMLKRQGKTVTEDEQTQMIELFEKHLNEIINWLNNIPFASVLFVNYNEMLENPAEEINKINNFFGNKLDKVNMAKVVDKALYRNRSESSEREEKQQPSVTADDFITEEDQEAVAERLRQLGYL